MDSISQPATPSIESIGRADLLVGILADLSHDDVASACDALRTLPGTPRIVVLQDHATDQPLPAVPEASDFPAKDSSLFLVPWSKRNLGATATPIESVSTAYESIFETGEKLDVRAFCIVASKLENAQPGWLCQLAQPLLEGFDLVAPCYARRKLEGLLNSSIVSPLTRSLYGKRIQNPMGPDLGISRRLYQDVLSAGQDAAPAGNGMRLLAGLAPVASYDDFKVCQAYLGSRVYPPVDWTNVSSLLTEILWACFLGHGKTRSSLAANAKFEPGHYFERVDASGVTVGRDTRNRTASEFVPVGHAGLARDLEISPSPGDIIRIAKDLAGNILHSR